MTALGSFVRDHRTELGLTQAALAARMGVDDTYISAVETGRRTPDGSPFLDMLGRALELDSDGRRQLNDAARRSQRFFRLPEELSPRKHAVLMAIAEDLPQLSPADVEVIASVHAALVRNRKFDAPHNVDVIKGGAM
ncbi:MULTISPECIES: helix-turn-helix transcriptional regulator [Burkholderia]|uniref:helix-turn-helix domain-containing protein n=1 Tax=Burkholderia TaxID=32008 RepID=UPI00084194CF|nr:MULTISPECIES: helix-turn-helix transcriptional regulator [Burkholderia]AOI80970.1 DNA-binding protein [Burkholderia cepacia]RQZ47165.1 XRE family transcriptional regulator [Burkholderia sp. Bp9099]HDR9159187.1 helix-turn-helix domain-containing protein [Burkholderia vietnamiensis]